MWPWWKRIGIALFLLALAGGVLSSNTWYRYQATLPRHPDQAAGNIYPLNVHGIVVYQTRDQRDRLDKLDYSSFWAWDRCCAHGTNSYEEIRATARPC
jgi:hypothetical protein